MGQEADRKQGAKAGHLVSTGGRRVHSPGTLGTPKEGQLVWGEVGTEEAETL